MGHLVLANLDTGLFFDKGTWMHDHHLAQRFPDHSMISRVANQLEIKNAAGAFIDGNPPRIHGYFWVSNSNQDIKK